MFKNKNRFSLLAGVAAIAIPALVARPAHAQFYIYGATTAGAIWEVDPVAVTKQEVANFGSNINGLAWVPGGLTGGGVDGRLYFTESVSAPGDGDTRYWDRDSNTFSASLGNFDGAFDNGSYYDGGLWYVDGNGATDTMFRLDLATMTTISFTNFDGTARTDFDFGDLVVTPSGKVYGYSSDRLATPSTPTFFSMDITGSAGSGYALANYTQTNTPGNYQLGIDLGGGILYGTGGVNTGAGGENWFTIDGSTGGTTPITGLVTAAFTDLSGKAALPAGAGGTGVTAPEPGTLAFALFGIFGGAIARRRKQK
jgi:hypothetical protein